MSKDGTLILDDRRAFRDDFTWSDPAESEFQWQFNEPGNSHVETHPEEGYVSIHTTAVNEIAELVQDNGHRYDLDDHSDWRLNVIERNAQANVGAAWEFWFTDPDSRGIPWLLIDAGGGGDIESTESSDDSCGDGFYTRKDQLLTKHYQRQFSVGRLMDTPVNYLREYFTRRSGEFGTVQWCWDEFANAPLDHSTPTKLSLELLGSSGEVNGYVDDVLQADLRSEDDQHVITDQSLVAAVRLHDRGDHDETGYVHYLDVQKVGVKRLEGRYRRVLDARRTVSWETADVRGTVPDGTSVDVTFGVGGADEGQMYEEIEAVPESRRLLVEIEMETRDQQITPGISGLTVGYESA